MKELNTKKLGIAGGNCGSRYHRHRDRDDDHQQVGYRGHDQDDPHQYFFAKVHRPSPFGHPEHPSGHDMGYGFVPFLNTNKSQTLLPRLL